jgi:hypothetical protein
MKVSELQNFKKINTKKSDEDTITSFLNLINTLDNIPIDKLNEISY